MNQMIQNDEVSPDPICRDVQMIAFSRLRRGEKNVRTIQPDKDEDMSLLNSIGEVGLLQNLTVVPDVENDTFAVVAGGRRFGALETLYEKGNITADTLVPCLVTTSELAVTVSLMENEDRAKMHDADRFKAYRRLIDDGSSVEQVARRFSVTCRTVEQMLRLSHVHTRLFGLFERSKIDLATMIAYATSADTKQQIAVFKQLGQEAPPHMVKRAITEGFTEHTSALVRFVSLSAYRKAGGVTENDLFSNVEYLKDHELLLSIAGKKLERAADKLSGWKWVATALDGGKDLYRYGRIHSHLGEVPPELEQKRQELMNKMEAFESLDEDQWTDEVSQQCGEVEDALNALEQRLDNEFSVFDPDDMAHAGCVVTFDNKGKLRVIEGLQSDEDVAEQRRVKRASTPDTPTDDSDNSNDGPSLSQKLTNDLCLIRRAAIRQALIGNATLATELLHFTICLRVLEPYDYRSRELIGIRVDLQQDDTSIESDPHHGCADAMLARYEKLDLSWLTEEEPLAMFNAYTALSKSRRQAIVAWCVSRLLVAGGAMTGENPLLDLVATTTSTDVAGHWRPSADNYFNRVTKSVLLTHCEHLFGSSGTERRSSASKKELVAELEAFFHGSTDELTDEQLALRNSWLPEQLHIG